jgi:hypothetical protein
VLIIPLMVVPVLMVLLVILLMVLVILLMVPNKQKWDKRPDDQDGSGFIN